MYIWVHQTVINPITSPNHTTHNVIIMWVQQKQCIDNTFSDSTVATLALWRHYIDSELANNVALDVSGSGCKQLWQFRHTRSSWSLHASLRRKKLQTCETSTEVCSISIYMESARWVSRKNAAFCYRVAQCEHVHEQKKTHQMEKQSKIWVSLHAL